MLKLFSNGDKDFHFWPRRKLVIQTMQSGNNKLVFTVACLYPI